MAFRRGHARTLTPNVLNLLMASALALVVSACTHVESERFPTPSGAEAAAPEQTPNKPYKDAVAIVVSSDAPAYLGVARALAERLGRDYLRYSLDNAEAAVIRELIQREEHAEVVAVGQAAARAVHAMGPERVIYCQVFYDNELRQQGYRGVAAVPAFDLQLRHWMELRPGLKHIGVIVSADSRQLARDLKVAAAKRGLTVHHEEAASDKQALFLYQRLIPEIDGFLFLPDTKILSPSVIRRMMSYGVKHQKSMLVYSPMMFELGGSILVSSKPADVANQIVALLDAGPSLKRRELTDATITVRRAEQMALAAPPVESTP